MNYRSLGPIKKVSRLALGGGGIGQVWGATDRDEALATVDAAVAAAAAIIAAAVALVWTVRRRRDGYPPEHTEDSSAAERSCAAKEGPRAGGA